ncbi:MAG TPA: hypothetical protein PK156_13300 [Polyangium sp.]|nr:hypothetical protein [Polyangium sp.]
MSEAAVAIPLIIGVVGLLTTLAITLRNVRRGRTPAELLGHASLFVMVTSVFQAAGVLGALAVITVTNDRPIPIIDRILWIPAQGLTVIAWACWAIAAMALTRQQLITDSEQKTSLQRRWFVLVLLAGVVAALQWTQGKISDIVAEARHAIYYEESRISFRAVAEPEPVNALRSREVRRIELMNSSGAAVGVAVDTQGMALRWDARASGSDTGSPLLLPGAVNTAFVTGGYSCAIASDAHASCSRMDPISHGSSTVLVVDGRAKSFLPAPVCDGHVRVCALVDPEAVRCFVENSSEGFREESLPIRDGIRSMTPQFGCIGCFVGTTGHVRCLVRGANGEVVKNDLEGIDDVVAIASSLDQACAIDRDGRLSCWSLDDNAKHGRESGPWKSQRIADMRAKQVSVSQTHACAVDESGKVYCWGSNRWGELCDGSQVDRGLPVAAIGVSDATMVSVENSVTCIVRRKGDVACCGKQRRRW